MPEFDLKSKVSPSVIQNIADLDLAGKELTSLSTSARDQARRDAMSPAAVILGWFKDIHHFRQELVNHGFNELSNRLGQLVKSLKQTAGS